VPTPVEIYRDARAYNGGGSTDIWYRWGYVAHPAGYDWNGTTTAFPQDAHYMAVNDAGTMKDFIAIAGSGLTVSEATPILNTKGVWTRKASSALSLGILPIFHS
jgi:hypothetical protein